ncbi:MAG: RNA-directed DNA polymerase, partial [Verrucomicrobiia bacterium]
MRTNTATLQGVPTPFFVSKERDASGNFHILLDNRVNYPLLKRVLNLPVAVDWLMEDAKDDFFPDPLGFKEISVFKQSYLTQREHRFLQIESVTSRVEYVPKASGMLREAIWLHPNHRLVYLAVLHHLLPRIDNLVLRCVYSYRRDAEDPDAYPFSERIDRWKNFHNDFRAACLDGNIQAVLVTDIASFYDHIDINHLCDKLESMLGKSATDSDREVVGFLRTLLQTWSTTGFGIPQNFDPSSFFGSVYLHNVDAAMEGNRFNYFRWVDDIRVCAKNRQQALRALHFLQQELAKERLFLASDKTRIILKGTPEFDRLVDVADDILISNSEEAIARGELAELKAMAQKCLERVNYHASSDGDDRKFRAFCNRLLDCASFTELRDLIRPKVIDLVLPRLNSHVGRSDYWCKMLTADRSGRILADLEKLLVTEKSIFDWQRFHMWKLLTTYDPGAGGLERFLAEAKSVATNHVSDLEA